MHRSTHPRIGIALGGGAPNSTLIAGALVAFAEAKTHFDIMATSGAGALMGLLYRCPQGGDPVEALTRWARVGIADELYKLFPVNHKVFMKPGDQAHRFRQALEDHPMMQIYRQVFPQGGLFHDLCNLTLASLCPSNLSKKSLGLCAHLPFVEDYVDFEQGRQLPGEFYFNAFNLDRSSMRIWNKAELSPERIRAAFSFPFIYPPYELDGEWYIEGASLEPLNFAALRQPEVEEALDVVIIADILGDFRLLQKPRDLYDAWVKSIITPLIRISHSDTQHYKRQMAEQGKTVLSLDFYRHVPADWLPQVFDWSESNLTRLFEIGYQTGRGFLQEHADLLNGTRPRHGADWPLPRAA
ncbi:patatin-like phospholipase family protein [Zoogloea sp.]|uniref:patatin-like phospholipase family protein n=1 Tax=Zoogloea sp. TaxID=49181 RepID=UPI0035B32CFA